MAVELAALNTVVGLIPTAAVDVVGVYTQEFIQVFSGARPIKAEIKEDSKVMEHPLETGATTVDHRIILPVEIELFMVLPSSVYRETYETIKRLFLNGTLLVVQTKATVYQNQLIASMPHVEDAEMFDALSMQLRLKEVQFANSPTQIAPKDPQDSSSVNRGNIEPSAASPTQTEQASEFYKLVN